MTHDDVNTFRTEARTIARLVHPHIVRVFDFGIDGETPFLVMDYAPNGTITEFPIPITSSSPGSNPSGITAGPDGNLWFTESAVNKIGRISPRGTITEFPVPTTGSGPDGITAGPNGNLWFTEYDGNKIGRITSSK
jgi:sugar lactone lactonase YvrE